MNPASEAERHGRRGKAFPISAANSTCRGHRRESGRCRRGYSVEMSPADVATIQRLPHRTIESTRPTPGTLSPVFTVQT